MTDQGFTNISGTTNEDHLPDESTILRFRHLLDAHNLSVQILATVNATLTAQPRACCSSKAR